MEDLPASENRIAVSGKHMNPDHDFISVTIPAFVRRAAIGIYYNESRIRDALIPSAERYSSPV